MMVKFIATMRLKPMKYLIISAKSLVFLKICILDFLDENSDDSNLYEDIQTVTDDAFENITNESIQENNSLKQNAQVDLEQMQTDVVKNTKDGTVSKKKVFRKKICTKRKNFLCDDCGYAAISESILEKHINGVHLKLKPFKCTNILAVD